MHANARTIRQSDKVFMVRRHMRFELLYYCPTCESVNEISTFDNIAALVCHDCKQVCSATWAALEIIDSTHELTEPFDVPRRILFL